ncbi:MAG: NAD(P)-dependent oxidoreductase [Candidatus Korobacteraceae bacterium]|jgi:putative NADH-flavin reductase
MKVALLGATGKAGSRLVKELVSRGHEVTAISRHPEKVEGHKQVKAVQGDVHSEEALAKILAGHNAVIHAVRFVDTNPAKVIAATKQAGVPRLLVVGGAGSLEAAPGLAVVDTPSFPAAVRPEALAGAEFLKMLRAEKALTWTFLSPSAIFAPGERSGKFRLGKDKLLVAEDGKSHISMEDFAIAFVDELERPQHNGERFTVGY